MPGNLRSVIVSCAITPGTNLAEVEGFILAKQPIWVAHLFGKVCSNQTASALIY